MPIRQNEYNPLITRDYGNGNTVTKTELEWEAGDHRIKIIDGWNADVSEYVEALTLKLNSGNDRNIISLQLKRYKKLDENKGFEQVKPRNYLSYEKLEVSTSTKNFNYYFGRFEDLSMLTEKIKKDIYGGDSTEEE